MAKKSSQNRKWFLTINNPAEHEMSHEQIKAIIGKYKGEIYWCMCDEIGLETNTYHTHVFIFRPSPFKFEQIKKDFPSAHIDPGAGTIQEIRDYIRKEGKYAGSAKEDTNLKDTFEESGDPPHEKQGERTDLSNLYEFIKSGMSDYEILEEDPAYMRRLPDIERVRNIVRAEEFRNKLRDMQVEYWYGETGSGKTFGVLSKWGFENVYRVTDYRHPWDGYAGQDVVLFEEFHGQVEISEMLVWLDRYPLALPCRYNNKTACFTKVYITSNKRLDLQYQHIQRESPETWRAFLRRIHCTKFFDGKTIREYRNVASEVDRSGFLTISEEDEKSLPFSQP